MNYCIKPRSTFCERQMIQSWWTTEGYWFSTRFGTIYSLFSSHLALANYCCICAGFARDWQNFAKGIVNLRRRDFSCQYLLELTLVGGNISNLPSTCALVRPCLLQHNHVKLQQHYPNVTLQAQLLAQGLEMPKQKDKLPVTDNYLMQNWEILITVRKKHMG